MQNFIIQIDDEKRGRGRKIYLTTWGTSVWEFHAEKFEEKEAEKRLSEYLNINKDEIGRVVKKDS